MAKPDGGIAHVPVWWPVLTALLAAIFSAGATYSTIGYRITTLETRVGAIETDRRDTLRDWAAWRSNTDQRVKGVEDGMDHVSKMVDRIADKLGVVH